jgi:hypothetical protein
MDTIVDECNPFDAKQNVISICAYFETVVS